MNIRLASDIECDSIMDGPGLRAVVWTQGCKHNCEGCHNPETHNFNSGIELSIDEVVSKFKKLKIHRGVTFSGGDPFEQPYPLSVAAEKAKEIGLDVWAYTGYTFEELTASDNDKREDNLKFLKNIDILVDGKFVAELKDIKIRFRGSKNQRIIDVSKTLIAGEIVLATEYYEK